jgi:hypothetical protein
VLASPSCLERCFAYPKRDDEVFLIVEGQHRVFVEGGWTNAGPRSVVYLLRGVAHTFHVVGEQSGRHWVLTTSGDFERFYTRCGEVFAVPGPPDRTRLAALGAEHGMGLGQPVDGRAARRPAERRLAPFRVMVSPGAKKGEHVRTDRRRPRFTGAWRATQVLTGT